MLKIKLVLSFLCLSLAAAFAENKLAPENTFRLQDKPLSISDDAMIVKQIDELRQKIQNLNTTEPKNFFLKKFHEFRVTRLEDQLEKIEND